jgi:SUZ domain
MTREEREAKYKEARERIFGTAEEAENKDGENKSDENDISRSSSAAGKKKQRKKTPINDDDFQPRSSFQPPFFQPPYGQGVYTDSVYYAQYAQAMPGQQFPGMAQGQPQMGYSNGYPQMVPPEQQLQLVYQPQQFGQYPSPNATGYDLSAQFQRGMQSFQSASPSPPGPPNLASPQPTQQAQFSPQFPVQPQSQPYSPTWQQPVPFGSPYQYGQPSFAQPQFPDRPLSSPGQLHGPATYPYTPPPNVGFPGGQNPYIRGGQFNPQSQTFTPTNTIRQPMSMGQQMTSGMPMPIPSPGYRNVSSGSYTGGYNSPRPGPQTNATTGTQIPTMVSASPTANGQQTPGNSSQAPMHPLPQRPIPDSSISKWGTPSHLPPKPPPPESMEPHKYNELNRGLQGLPGLPKITGNAMFAVPLNGPPAGPLMGNGPGNAAVRK